MRFILPILLILIPIAYAGELQITSGSDKLGINESIGDVTGTLNEANFPPFAKGTIITNQGTTTYNQFIRFKDTTTTIQAGKVQYIKGDNVGLYFHSIKGDNVTSALFEYEIKFDQGLKSKLSSGVLESLNGIKLILFGEEFIFLSGKADATTKSVELNLLKSANSATLKENETQFFNVNNKSQEIKILAITQAGANQVSLSLNGQTITIKEGEIRNTGGILVAVSKVVIGQDNDMATIFVGAENIRLKDTNYEDDSFTQGLEVKSDLLTEGYVKIKGAVEDGNFKIDDIFYRLLPRSKSGDDIYLEEGDKLSNEIANKGGMISDLWDLEFRAMSDAGYNIINFDPSGDTQYDLEFTNKKGNSYTVPFLSYENGYKLGNAQRDLLFIEGTSNSDYIINLNDYFVLTSSNTKTGTTGIIQYESYDLVNNRIYFEDILTGEIVASYVSSNVTNALGEGSLVFDGQAYKFYVKNDSATNYSLSVDLNKDGSINSGEAKIIVKGGGILDLGSTNTPSGNFDLTLTTGSAEFDEAPASDEVITITMEKRDTQVGIKNVTGIPLVSSGQHKSMITNYGVLVDFGQKANGSENLLIKYPASQVLPKVYVTYNVKTIVAESCFDKLQNQGETGIDCGGPCAACQLKNETTVIQNQTNETVQVSTCDGCEREGTCYKIGVAVGVQYCSPDKDFKFLKDYGEICAYNYQCSSQICTEGKCAKTKGEVNYLLIFANLIAIILIVVFLIHFYKSTRKQETKPL